MRIRIVAVGKMKEDYLLKAQKEYEKRLSRFGKIEIVEVADEPTPENPTRAQKQSILGKEAGRIEKVVAGFPNRVVLAIEGKQETSEEFAGQISRMMQSGQPDVCFIIGGSLGILDELKAKATAKLSLSKMTMPHRIARIVLLEQIYRGFKILSGETYHK